MREVLASLKAGKPAPVYLLYGPERTPALELVQALRAALLDPAAVTFNHERLEIDASTGVGPLLQACGQLPFLGKWRVVEATGLDALKEGTDADEGDDAGPAATPRAARQKGPKGAGPARSAPKGPVDALIEYIKGPNPTTVLVLLAPALDGRSKLVSAVKKVGVCLKFEPPKRDEDAVTYLVDRARTLGLRLEASAARTLVEAVGPSPSELATALDQAATYAGPGVAITSAHVSDVVVRTREEVVFELTDAVAEGQRGTALEILARIFQEGGSSEVGQAAIVGSMLLRQFRLLFAAVASGGTDDLGLHPFVARKLAGQARRYDERRLRHAYALLARFDRDQKGGSSIVGAHPYLGLQRLIVELCGRIDGTASRT